MTPPPNSELFCYIIIVYFPTPSRESRVSSKMFDISLSLFDMITGIILSSFVSNIFFYIFQIADFTTNYTFGRLGFQKTIQFLFLNPNTRNLFTANLS